MQIQDLVIVKAKIIMKAAADGGRQYGFNIFCPSRIVACKTFGFCFLLLREAEG